MTFVVQLKGLPEEGMTEEIILQRLSHFQQPEIEYVKLIKDKATGKFKGKALVKFKEEAVAEAFLYEHPVIDVLDEPVWVERGFEHSAEDWQCVGCRSVNLSHRERCFKCSKRRKVVLESIQLPVLPGSDDISPGPSKFLLLQNVNEHQTSEQVRRVCLMVDRLDGRSKRFAFLQFESLEESQRALKLLTEAALFPSVRFGRDLCDLAVLSPSTSKHGLAYWDPACDFDLFPREADEEKSPAESLSETKPTTNQPSSTPAATKLPILFTSTRPVKRLQLQKWTAAAAANVEVEADKGQGSTTTTTEFLDFKVFTCKLCQENFDSASELKEHAQRSQIHADNYDSLVRREAESSTIIHRDRAAERKNVFAIDSDDDEKGGLDGTIGVDGVKEDSITLPMDCTDSFGAKLLKKMGWQAGKGLGRDESGIKEPIKARTMESVGAGLGAAELINAEELGRSYSDRVKRGSRQRFREAK